MDNDKAVTGAMAAATIAACAVDVGAPKERSAPLVVAPIFFGSVSWLEYSQTKVYLNSIFTLSFFGLWNASSA
jgi:hypothetical protein